jgi:hypothetical protein
MADSSVCRKCAKAPQLPVNSQLPLQPSRDLPCERILGATYLICNGGRSRTRTVDLLLVRQVENWPP